MSKDPAVLFYTSDFLIGVSDMPFLERGYYITLLCLQHQKGHLSEETICFSLGLRSVIEIPIVMQKFKRDEEGKFYQRRMEEESEKRAKYSESRKNNGKKGGRPAKKDIKHMGNHMGNENEDINRDINIPQEETKGNEETIATRAKMTDKDFDIFWSSYPRKVGKQDAKKAFRKIKPDLLSTILAAIVSQCKTEQWMTDNGNYIPYPSTWLNGKRWEDETTEYVPQKKGYTPAAERQSIKPTENDVNQTQKFLKKLRED